MPRNRPVKALRAEQPLTEAAAAILRAKLPAVLRYEAGVEAGGVDAIHDMRIESKRLREVLRVLQDESHPLTAMEMGERLRLSRSTARRYLEFLVETELVRVEHAYKEIGRPLKQYVLKRTANPLPAF